MDNSGDNRKAVYDYLKAYTNYKDDYDTFNKSFDESDKMRRVYYDKVKETGGYEGSYDEFLNKLGVNNGSAGSVAQQVIDEYDASMRNAKPVNPTTPTNDVSQFAQALQEPDWRSDETKLLDEIATSGKATVETLDGEERYPTKPIEVRYDESVQDARNQAVNHKNDAANQLNSLYEDIKKQVDAIPRRVPRPYEAMAGLTEQQLEENRLRAAKRLVEDAKEVIEEAGRKGKTNFIAGLGRGIADKIADPENWNFGITDLADNKYLLDALKKSDKGEELTPAEDKLLQAATTSMAVNYYYSQDLGRGYKAGKTTAESIPFMLEFMINPISQSGSGIAKSLLKYGMKKFGAKAVNRGVTRAAGRLIGDAAAAAGMTATTGAANTLASAYEKQVRNYDYRYDDNGNVIVQKTGDMGEGEALARGFLSTFLENQSEMVFGAFAGAGKALSGIIPSISKLSDNGLVRFYNSIKNAPLAKQLRERVKIGGVVEEYAEEVYNNLANVALGEMTAEDALSVDTNIDTFLGLVPTQLAFSAIGLGGLARENMAAKRRLQAFEERLTDEEKSLFSQLQEAVRSGDNNAARDYIKATLADNSLTEQEKKERIFAAKDMVAAQQAEEIGQEQTQEEQEADAAYTEGVSADPSTYYERYKASRTAASALEQADANLYETINRYVEDDASTGEVENLLSGLEGETEQLARNYLNSLMQLKGAEDAQMQAAVEAVDVFDKSVSPYVYQNEDGTRSITTGTYKGRPVYVLPGEGGNVVVAYEDGVKEIALSKDVENQSTSDYDEFIDNYSRDYLTSKEQEFRQKLENHPKTQEPAPGLVLHNGDMTYIVTDVSEDGYVDIVPAYYDPESGRNYAKENSSIQTISRETAMMLQNDYYNAIDNTPENTVQTESGNNLSENQSKNESGSSGGESNVSEQAQVDAKPVLSASQKEIESLRNAGASEESISNTITQRFNNAKKAYEKAKKAMNAPFKEGVDPVTEIQKRKNALDAAKSEYKEWEKIAPVQEKVDNLSENQADNDRSTQESESNVSEERQEDTPGQKLANLVASLPKKGNTGEIDYNAMTPQQRYEYTSLTESPETAAQDLQADIKAKQKELDDMQKKLDNSVGGKRTELRDKMRKVRSELSELTDYYQGIATEDQTGSQRQPEGYSANTREVVSEYMNDVQNEEDYLEWVAEESEDELEVASAYNLAKEMTSRELKLNPWQQELLGTHVNTDSFKRFGDRNLITGTLAKSWLRKDGRDLDILAQELSVQTGMQVTEQDIVDFMLAHPSNRVSQTSDIMNRLAKKFSNIASAEMRFPVGGPESNTGRLYIRLKEAGQKVDELTEQQTREAEGAFAEDIQDNASDIAAVEEAITEEYAALYDEAIGRMDEEEADRIAVEELEKEPLYEGMTAEELDDIYSSLEYQQYGTEGQRTDSEQVPAEQVQEGTGESETSENERVLPEDDSQNGAEDSGTGRTEVANSEELLPESPESANERRMNQIIERLDEIEYRLSELEGKTDIFSEAEVITLNNEKDELESEYDGLRRINATSEAIQEAREEVNTSPTDAQKEAGNYKKGHVSIDGLDVSIENPKGSVRSGVDADGNAWSVTMQNDYGYIRGTKAVDGDHIDIFLSDSPAIGNVYVVDAIDQQTGAFDESKVMYGFNSMEEARDAYLSNYSEGWKVGPITEVSKEEFKKWIDSSKRKGKPFGEYKSINKETKQRKSSNRLVTDERYAELKERMRKKLGGQLNVGIDPEILAIGTEMAVYHIEKGARKFAEYAKAMIEDLGDIIRPYLKAFYNGARELPEMEDAGYTNEMTPYEEVRNFDTANFGNPSMDVLELAQTIADEQVIDKQADKVKEQIKKEKTKKRKAAPSKSIKKSVSSQKETINDLFNQNQQEDEPRNQTENQGLGGEAREEDRGTGLRGEGSSVHGRNVSDQDGGRGVHGGTGTERPVTEKRNTRNFRFGESGIDVPSGEIGKLKANIEAIRTLKELEESGKPATQEQKTKLSRYVGWGGLANALDENEYIRQKSLFERYGNDSRNYTPWGQKYYQYHEELKQLLTPEEFRSAIESTTTSHYTPQEIIQSLWGIVQRAGFKGGTISEPALGIGHILGYMPATLSENSLISGFELDSLSGRIAYALYPDARVKVQGYETEFAPQSKDLVITNVPFAKEAPYDKALDKTFRKQLGSSYNLHNYFILKSLLELKQGGMGVFVTSSATMDGVDSRFREYLSGNEIDLIGAIRLPNDAFFKNAGTSVTADILVFRKRKAGEPGNGNRFTSTTQIGEGSYQENGEIRTKPIMVNEYFAKHPEMMLGEMMTAYDAGSGGLYSGASQTLKAKPGTDLGKALDEAVQKLPENILDGTENVSQQGRERTDIRNGLITAKDGKVFVSENGELVPIEAKDFKYNGKTRKVSDAVNDYNEIKSALKELIAEEQKENGKPEPLRKKLNELYDGFVEKYGTLNRNKALDDVFAEDVEHNLPLSLENVRRVPSATGKSMVYVVEKAKGFLDKRISYPVKEPEKAESLQDAINISQSYHGSMDVPYISRLLGISEEETTNRLLEEGAAYKDPVTGELQDKDTYLSGNVREKLEVAIAASENNPEYKKNVDDLMEVQPETVRFGDISFRLGTPWIPTEHVNKFAEDVLGISDADITYMPSLNEFVLGKKARVTDFAKAGLYRTDRLGVIEVLDSAINQRKPKIYDEHTEYGPNGKTTIRVPNEAETQASSEKIMEVSDKFTEYIESRKDLHRELERIYNDRYNNYRLKEYRLPAFAKVEKNKEGNSVTIIHYPNSNNDISLREHQAKAVQRSLSESTLLAHQVGTGKTFTMITTAMEMRRLGIARKPMIVVQNATLEDFVRDFYKLYPGANVLAPSKDERSAENRKRLFNLIATGDFDAIVIPQSFLQFIPDDEGRKKQLIQKRIDELEEVLSNIEEYGLRKRLEREIEGLRDSFEGVEKKRKVKDQAKSAARIKAKMERQLDRRTDDVMTFEQMGIDALFIDEAHNYKKIGFATKMNNVKGVDSSASQRANSLLLKAKWIQEKNGGRNVILATGTPITNTMAEVWTMMNFVAPEMLDDYQINSFDDFATTFGTVEPSLEFTATGNFKIADRFKSYVNVPELVKAFRSHTDVVLTEDVKEFKESNNIPKLKNGKMTNVVIDKNEDLEDVMQMLIDRLEDYNKMSGKEKRKWSALPLVVFTKAKQAAIDLRLLNPSYPDNPNSKTNQVVDNIVKLYKESTPDKGTQLVFCDSYQSPGEQPRMDLFDYNPNVPRFNLYEDIREKLIAKGIPANEIAIVNNYDGERRKTLFEKVRNGDVRVLLGSTEKMGVGVNVQDRLYALHHIDAPIRPMDFEQRNGRILRQGNLYAVWGNPVNVVTYGVQGTLDATAYDRLRIKQAFINQMMKGDVSGRVMEEQDEDDPSGMTFSQMAATLSGDKTAQLLFAAQNKLKRLRNLKRSDANSKSSMADTIEANRNRIIILEGQKKVYERAYSTVSKHFPDGVTSATINGKTFTDKIGAELEPIISEYDEKYLLNRGIAPLKISLNSGNAEVIVHYIEGRMVYEMYAGGEHIVEGRQFNGGKGLMSSIDHQLKATKRNLEETVDKIKDCENRIEGLTKAMNAPWGREEELKEAEKEVAKLQKKLEEKAVDATKNKQSKSEDSDSTMFRTNEDNRFTTEYQLDPEKTYHVRFAYNMKSDMDRGWSSWNFYDSIGSGTQEDVLEYLNEKKENGESLDVSGVEIELSDSDIYKDGDSIIIEYDDTVYEFRNPGDNSWVWVDNDNAPGGLSSHQIKNTEEFNNVGDLVDYVKSNPNKFDGMGDGQFFVADNSRVIYKFNVPNEKRSVYIVEENADVPDKVINKKDATSNESYREGQGIQTEASISLANNPASKIAGATRRSSEKQKEYAERENRRMVGRARSLSEQLGLYNVEIVTDASTLEGDKSRAKGFYDPKTGKITIVIPNHRNSYDVEQTILHEAVAHYGLRKLFGEHFDTFLDNVYNNASSEVRERIDAFAKKYNGNLHTATEEYLASLAENTDFENAVHSNWFDKIKTFFLKMLAEVGITLPSLTDNELRYILWRSYENLAHHGHYRNVFETASDVVMQNKLKVGNYADAQQEQRNVAEVGDIYPKTKNVPSKELIGVKPTLDDYFDMTYTNFYDISNREGSTNKQREESVLNQWKNMKSSNKYEFHKSPNSSSEYLIDRNNGDIYRFSDHWGDVSSCLWTINGTNGVKPYKTSYGLIEPFSIGKSNIDNFSRDKKDLKYWMLESHDKKIKNEEHIESNVLFRETDETNIYDDQELNIVNKEVGEAREQYERSLQTASYKFTEAWQDSMLGLKEAQDAIAKATKSKILDYENAYLAENALSSKNLAEMDAYRNLVFKPILEEVNKLKKQGAGYKEITDYLMLKHGIERNREMAVRKALEEDNETAEENLQRWNEEKNAILASSGTWEDKQRQLDELALTYGAEMKDYSGMTEMLPEYDDMESITNEAYRRVNEFESKYNTEELYKRIGAANKATLKKQVESGLMSKEMYQNISSMYQFYVPLRGWEQKTADEVYDYLTTEHSSFNAPIRTAKGRKSKADDPIATIANMAESGIIQGNKNLVKQRFLTMVQNHRTDLASINELWVRENENGEWTAIFPDIPDKATPEEVEKIVEAFNSRMEEKSKEENSNVKRASDMANVPYKILPRDLKEHQVVVKRSGKPYVVTINGNPRAAQAVNGLTNPNSTENPMIKALESANRFMASNFTQRNPAFVVSNMVRDGIYSNTSVWVKESPLYAAKYNQNWAKSVKEMGGLVRRYKSNTLDMSNPTDRMFYEFIMNGGETGYTFINSVEDYKGIIQKEIKRANRKTLSPGKALDVLGSAMDTFGRWAEDASRFAAYRTSREMGRSVTRSVNDAKEISVNFNKKGAGAKTAGKWEKGNRINALQAWASQTARGLYIFWNAGVQGLTNFARLAKRNPGKFSAAAATYLTLGSLAPLINEALCSALGGDDDDANYYNLPEYVRRNNICIYLGGSWLTIPLPIELRALYGLGELASSVLSGKEKYQTGKVAGQVSQILPIDMLEGSGGLNNLLPSYYKPIHEAYVANKSWTGIPIYKENDFNRNMPEWTKAYKSTSPELIELGSILNEWSGGTKYRKGYVDINPSRIEYLFSSYLGGIATTIDQIKKTAMMPFNEDMKDLRNVPVLSRFLKNADSRSTQKRIDNDYYEHKKDFDLFRQELNGYKKELKSLNSKTDDFAEYLRMYNELINSEKYRKFQMFNEMDKSLKKMGDVFKNTGDEELEKQMYVLKEAMNEVAK